MPTKEEMLVQSLAKRCRSAYIRCRIEQEAQTLGRKVLYTPGPKWDGGVDRFGHEHKAIWPSIAKFMLANGLHPEECIKWRFEQSRKSGKLTLPTQIACAHLVADYKSMSEQRHTDIDLRFNSEREILLNYVYGRMSVMDYSDEELWTFVLVDKSLDVSPLLKYCIAYEKNLNKVAEHLYDDALLQYLDAPKEYDRVMGQWLPEDFVTHANKIKTLAIKSAR